MRVDEWREQRSACTAGCIRSARLLWSALSMLWYGSRSAAVGACVHSMPCSCTRHPLLLDSRPAPCPRPLALPQVEKKNGKTTLRCPKIQRLVTPQVLQRERRRAAIKRERISRKKSEAADYHKLLVTRIKEERERRCALGALGVGAVGAVGSVGCFGGGGVLVRLGALGGCGRRAGGCRRRGAGHAWC